MLKVCVHPANLQDREGVKLLLRPPIQQYFPRLTHLFADQGYSGSGKAWIEQTLERVLETGRHDVTPYALLHEYDVPEQPL